MGTSLRHLLVSDSDDVFRLSRRFLEKLWEGSREASLPAFAGQRVRWVEAVLLFEDREPVEIIRIIYSYMHFDDRGRLNRRKMMQDAVLKMEAAAPIPPENSGTVIEASWRFAARRRDHEPSGNQARH